MFAAGYALTLAGNLLLLLLLFTVKKPGLAKRLLMLAVFVNMVWALANLAFALEMIQPAWMMQAESLKGLLWLLFTCSVLKRELTRFRGLITQPVTMLVIVLPMLALLLPWFSVLLKWQFLLHTVIALVVLVLLETLYRQSGEQRWHYKPLVIYLGATSLYDFVMFADATMVNQMDPMYWSARGYIYALLLPALVVGIRRIKHWGIEIFISRDVVLHSTLLLAAGGYLFVMAVAGYAIRYLGGDWSGPVQLVLLFLSLTLLAVLLLSNSVRARVKVFITKHFFANKYDYREEWLKLSESLNASEKSLPKVFEKGLRCFLQAINYDRGFLLKCNGSRLDVVSSTEERELTNVESDVLSQLQPFLEHKHWLVDIEELRYKPFLYEGLKINHAILNQCNFQLVVPIYQDDKLWGMALLHTSLAERVRLDWELRDYLSAVTAQVANYLFHYEAAQELAENAQFAAFNRMSAFVLHDLKNVLAQIDLILCNAEQHKDNPEFIEDTFETLHHTKTRMDRMLRQLTEKKEPQPSPTKTIDLVELTDKVISERCHQYKPTPEIQTLAEVSLSVDGEKLSNVLYHLISNAQQATADDGQVTVRVGMAQESGFALIEIEDNGCGMSIDFIANRLFKPFDTTKGNAGMGIGAYDAKNYIEKLGGRLEVSSSEGEGALFSLYLPL
ncbi:XrtA/PEP-CTERM system histidine kinase PrsK [Lacimicrobium alkaliphilum]|uniref:histidine kinase n=2 Tax=Lacimicrobium alkaliphilum TaxID=1526571 RepID=A0ABQ1RQQ1_9ALTE|nr:XrtA/PEP-CTERM system histidine kinase PrsK [Lacimicrobium alkaliphilum]GGD75063.1 histidine kinase [Lacimicrobium alkaliphilum]